MLTHRVYRIEATLKAVKPGADINENGRSVILRTTNPFLFVMQTQAMQIQTENQMNGFGKL